MKIAVLGYGTVGRGVVSIIESSVPSIEVARILELPDRLTDPRMTSNYDDILGDADIECVVECMGGLEPAHTYILQALDAGKNVVTSNKAVVAANFDEFTTHARERGVGLLIEATCGGGIPWIASLEKMRRIDEVSSFSGILNGTTNYIIDRMSKDNLEFGEVLAKAQELGYAERDPSADIDGIDVMNKTIISASMAFGVACTHDFPVSGIRNFTKGDLEFFRGRGRSLKLLGRGVKKDGAYAVAVEPVAVPADSLEAHVPDNFNLVTAVGATIGELKFYGQGAGSLPTGNAIVQDLIDAAGGRRPDYDFSAGLVYDPSLLAGDYVLRASDFEPAGATSLDGDYYLVADITATKARELLAEALSADPTAFVAALPKEG
jgi:homoserine dehydrogenase